MTVCNISAAQQAFTTALENLRKCEKAIQDYLFFFCTINSGNMKLFQQSHLAAVLPYSNLCY